MFKLMFKLKHILSVTPFYLCQMLTPSNCKYNLRKSELLLPKMFGVKQNEHVDQLPGPLGSLIQILAMSFKCKEAGGLGQNRERAGRESKDDLYPSPCLLFIPFSYLFIP